MTDTFDQVYRLRDIADAYNIEQMSEGDRAAYQRFVQVLGTCDTLPKLAIALLSLPGTPSADPAEGNPLKAFLLGNRPKNEIAFVNWVAEITGIEFPKELDFNNQACLIFSKILPLSKLNKLAKGEFNKIINGLADKGQLTREVVAALAVSLIVFPNDFKLIKTVANIASNNEATLSDILGQIPTKPDQIIPKRDLFATYSAPLPHESQTLSRSQSTRSATPPRLALLKTTDVSRTVKGLVEEGPLTPTEYKSMYSRLGTPSPNSSELSTPVWSDSEDGPEPSRKILGLDLAPLSRLTSPVFR